jgi:hypothetical protein
MGIGVYLVVVSGIFGEARQSLSDGSAPLARGLRFEVLEREVHADVEARGFSSRAS